MRFRSFVKRKSERRKGKESEVLTKVLALSPFLDEMPAIQRRGSSAF